MDKTTARGYIRGNFHEHDRLAIVLIQKSTGRVTQRIADVDRITSNQFQAWLRYMNSQRHEVYISMNALNPDARGRTKADVAAVRHVYLDVDKDGPAAIGALRAREDLPTPNHIIQSSTGKFQIVWRVEGFDKDEAEALMRSTVRDLGADPAATDSARVLRLPGFYNHKYSIPHFVSLEDLSERVYTPADFPSPAEEDRGAAVRNLPAKKLPTCGPVGGSQSERDWAYALRALARGEDPGDVTAAIERYRPDKPNPRYYAEHTVRQAIGALSVGSAKHEPVPDR
jgi:hypothetical protein